MKIFVRALNSGPSDEKIHEKMCSMQEARLTLNFEDHYVIQPTIIFHDYNVKYFKNAINEIGKPTPKDFEYRSDNNPVFLNVEEIKKINLNLKI